MWRRDGGGSGEGAPRVQGLAHRGLIGFAPQRLQLFLERVDRGQGLAGLHQSLKALDAGVVQTLLVAQQQVQVDLPLDGGLLALTEN